MLHFRVEGREPQASQQRCDTMFFTENPVICRFKGEKGTGRGEQNERSERIAHVAMCKLKESKYQLRIQFVAL